MMDDHRDIRNEKVQELVNILVKMTPEQFQKFKESIKDLLYPTRA
jgi:hypothetical protein